MQAAPREEEATIDMLGLSSTSARAEPQRVKSPSSNTLKDDLFGTPAAPQGQTSSPDIEALFGNAPAASQSQVLLHS